MSWGKKEFNGGEVGELKEKKIFQLAIAEAKRIAKENSPEVGASVAMDGDPMVYRLVEINKGSAQIEYERDGVIVKKEVPLEDLFDASIAMRAAFRIAVESSIG